MRSWTVADLDEVIASLQALRGLRLQEVLTSPEDVVLGFYSPAGLLWLWVDLNPVSPCLLPWMELPLKPQAAKTPLNLFLRAHFVDQVLSEVERLYEFGRVVRLHFGPDHVLELRLFPHGRNVIARAASKSLAWQKPTDLSASGETRAGEPRTLDQLREDWLARHKPSFKKSKKAVDPKARVEADLEKKRKALHKVEEELQRKKDLPWKTVGDWLKSHQTVDVPKEFEPFVEKRRKLAWNIDNAFTKAREAQGKIRGTEKRLEALQQEIAALEKKSTGPSLKAEPPVKPKPSLEQIGAQGRTLRLPNDVVVVAGKSAVDNMKILRRARAWDLWFHLRDFPSSHAVLFRNKNTPVADGVLHEVAGWFVRTHFGAKASQQIGEKFDVVVTECRHVRAIKGDKLGRVTFHAERVFTHKLT